MTALELWTWIAIGVLIMHLATFSVQEAIANAQSVAVNTRAPLMATYRSRVHTPSGPSAAKLHFAAPDHGFLAVLKRQADRAR